VPSCPQPVDKSWENYKFVIHKQRAAAHRPRVTLGRMPESKRRKPRSKGPTPPKRAIPKDAPESPRWYVALMAGLMAVGVILVLVRFFFRTDQWVLLLGLIAISAGFIMTTNYR
jgi:hypothetical protein